MHAHTNTCIHITQAHVHTLANTHTHTSIHTETDNEGYFSYKKSLKMIATCMLRAQCECKGSLRYRCRMQVLGKPPNSVVFVKERKTQCEFRKISSQ